MTTGRDDGRVRIAVAGDVCLDVVAVPLPGALPGQDVENWRLAGETRTHYLPGGALLLAEFVRSTRLAQAVTAARLRVESKIKNQQLTDEEKEARLFAAERRARHDVENEILGPRPKKPQTIHEGKAEGLYTDEFLAIAERLRRDEIVHSLLALDNYPTTLDPKGKGRTIRVHKELGYSGPQAGEDPTLKVTYFNNLADARVIVLDDTGNRFRKGVSDNPWPDAINKPASAAEATPLIVYKLHRPLPGSGAVNTLWDAVTKNHTNSLIVIASIGDLRQAGASISMGLSWERTATDIVWHLQNNVLFAPLKRCRRLIIRLGYEGAVLWTCRADAAGNEKYEAWLVYDPAGIEGSFARRIPGTMVSTGSAFTAAFVQKVAESGATRLTELVSVQPTTEKQDLELLLTAIQTGLAASRKLLKTGFGSASDIPDYPRADLFKDDERESKVFAERSIRIIPGAIEPDRSYWRLLDDLFDMSKPQIRAAVEMVATNRREVCLDKKAVEEQALALLKQVPVASFGALQTYDRVEIERYRALHTLLRDYLCAKAPPRPLSIAVFGPPGAGKSFGVKQVAKSLVGLQGCKEVADITFNLSLYQTPEELAAAFHLVRDEALKGKVPLVFFDEFDTALNNQPLAWLRQFLAPMQDGEFLDRGAPHPIGQAIFVFAGGTCATFQEFAKHPGMDAERFKSSKGPDFLSRLRATLDIPSINFMTARGPDPAAGALQSTLPPDTFDPYGPIEAFPSKAAILLRRAGILAFSLKGKAPSLVQADGSLAISDSVLRALLWMPRFEHGNRSFDALLDMSHLAGAHKYTPSLLPAAFQLPLHGDASNFNQLVATEFPFPDADREKIAKAIHADYKKQKKSTPGHDPNDPALKDWDELRPDLRDSTYGLADDYAAKLRAAGLWLRKVPGDKVVSGVIAQVNAQIEANVETLSKAEHDRWSAHKRQQGWAAGPDTSKESKIDELLLHNCIFPWEKLSDEQKDLDRVPIRALPQVLANAGYQIVKA